MGVVVSIIGVGLVLVAVRDVFHTLFHPDGRGRLSRSIGRTAWRAMRVAGRRRRRALALAGPLIVVLVAAAWLVLVVVGGALIYWPWLPEGFLVASGLDPAEQSGFLDALYASFVTLVTLGYGDLAPTSSWLRLVAPAEALLGFVILTAAVTWVLSIYPALGRVRRLCAGMATLEEAAGRGGDRWPDALPAESLPALLQELHPQLVAVQVDLMHFPVIHYFEPVSPRLSLANALPALVRLAELARRDHRPEVRLGGDRLGIAVDRVLATLAPEIVGVSAHCAPAAVLSAFRAERA